MSNCILENFDDKINTILNIINDDEFGLNDETKENNQISLVQIFSIVQNINIAQKIDLKKELDIEKLKSNNQEMVNKYYYEKNKEYKAKINIIKFNHLVNSLIYKELNSHSDEIINKIINYSLYLFIIQKIKESIKDQYQDYQKQIIKEIYDKLFIEQIENNLDKKNTNNLNYFQINSKNNKKSIISNRNNFKNINIIRKKPIRILEKKRRIKNSQ